MSKSNRFAWIASREARSFQQKRFITFNRLNRLRIYDWSHQTWFRYARSAIEGDTQLARGRKPLAKEVHIAKGSYRKDPQRENKSAPIADGLTPKKPKWLDKYESEKWDEITADLSSMKVMSSDTRELIIAYCQAYSGYRQSRDVIEKDGQIIDTKWGPKRHPAMTDMHKFREQMNKLLPEFGLTPSSRGKLVSFKADDEEDHFAELLSRMSGKN